jgi:8-oxo-dGTP pyrophosphatase MutT (NUDIX family)
MSQELINKLISNLPKYPGILGRDEFFNSAVLIPFVTVDDEVSLLFEKRAANIRQGGEICFPGGEFDRDEDGTFEHTAIRETHEEIGIPEDKIKILGRLDTLIGPRGVTIDPYIGEINIASLSECSVDETEVETVFTVPFSFFMHNEPLKYHAISKVEHRFYNEDGVEEQLIPAVQNSADPTYRESRRNVLVYKTDTEVIWGLTARMVYELVKLIKQN